MCLLEAPFIKGVERSVEEVIGATTAKLGEKISVRRFIRCGKSCVLVKGKGVLMVDFRLIVSTAGSFA